MVELTMAFNERIVKFPDGAVMRDKLKVKKPRRRLNKLSAINSLTKRRSDLQRRIQGLLRRVGFLYKSAQGNQYRLGKWLFLL